LYSGFSVSETVQPVDSIRDGAKGRQLAAACYTSRISLEISAILNLSLR